MARRVGNSYSEAAIGILLYRSIFDFLTLTFLIQFAELNFGLGKYFRLQKVK